MGYPAPPARARNGLGIAALAIGIAALVLCWTAVGGVILGLLAVIFSVVARRRVDRGQASNGPVAVAGLVLGSLGMVASLAVLVFFWGRTDVYIGRYLDSGDAAYRECLAGANDNDDAGVCREQLRERVERRP